MNGSNLDVDIPFENALQLTINYWKEVKPITYKKDPMCICVGDVHSDLHQFLAPLIVNNVIKLTGKIVDTVMFKNEKILIPEYEIINKNSIKIVYLGDIIDSGMFPKQVLRLVYELMIAGCNVKLLYGNHESRWLGCYDAVIKENNNIREENKNSLKTFNVGFNFTDYPDVSVSDTEIKLKGDLKSGDDFLNSYWREFLELLSYMHENDLIKVSEVVQYKKPLMLSHTTWTLKAITEITNKNYNFKEQTIKLYNEISDDVNKAFKQQDSYYLLKNKITYTRNINSFIPLNHVVGHSQPGSWRELNVNTAFGSFYSERLLKCQGIIVNNKNYNVVVYYIDFAASAIFNEDFISRPDYVMIFDEDKEYAKLVPSNLPGFIFTNKETMTVLENKSKHDGNRNFLSILKHSDISILKWIIN